MKKEDEIDSRSRSFIYFLSIFHFISPLSLCLCVSLFFTCSFSFVRSFALRVICVLMQPFNSCRAYKIKVSSMLKQQAKKISHTFAKIECAVWRIHSTATQQRHWNQFNDGTMYSFRDFCKSFRIESAQLALKILYLCICMCQSVSTFVRFSVFQNWHTSVHALHNLHWTHFASFFDKFKWR